MSIARNILSVWISPATTIQINFDMYATFVCSAKPQKSFLGFGEVLPKDEGKTGRLYIQGRASNVDLHILYSPLRINILPKTWLEWWVTVHSQMATLNPISSVLCLELDRTYSELETVAHQEFYLPM